MNSATAVVLIQSYRAEHADAVQRLLVGAGWAGSALPSVEVIGRAAQVKCAFVAMVQGEPEPIGFVRIVSDGKVVSYVAELAVAAGYRDRGVGRALLDACAAQFPSARIDLLSSEMAEDFYVRVGFGPKPGYRRWPQ